MSFWIEALNQGLIIAAFAVSLNVLLGYAGQLSIATVGLGGVGGYVAGYLSAKHGWALLPCLGAGATGGLVVGTLLGVPALRLGQDYLILMTLAFATIITAVITAIPELGGAQGLLGIQPLDIGGLLFQPEQLLRFVVPCFVVCYLVCWRLVGSPFGRVLRAIREDDESAEALGKDVVRFKVVTFAITSAVAGVAGVMLVFYQQIASPSSFGFGATLMVVAAVVIGGSGNLLGSVVGAVALAFVEPVLQRVLKLESDSAALWQLLVFGALLVLALQLRPSGLIPEGASLRGLLRRSRRSAPAPASASAAPAHAVTARVVATDAPSVNGASAAAGGGEIVVAARGLTKHFGGIRAVEGLDLDLPAGRITALLGPNGAGKTTVFNLLTGRIPPDAGEVKLRGRDVTRLSPHRTAALGMSRTFQDVRTLTRLTLLDNVRLGVPGQPGEHALTLYARPLHVRRSERATTEQALHWLAYVGLDGRADELAGQLGYGDQKLLSLARLLATGADVLLLDEPASGIDRGSLDPVLAVIERLPAEGKTICLVEHNIDVVMRLAHHVLFMEQGRVTAQGTMDEITRIDRLAEVYFGHV